MDSLSKGIVKAEVALKWDPNPAGAPDHDLDVVAGTFRADDPYGSPVYLVYFGSRSPDGTITLDRDSRDGRGLGFDEVMTLELDRLAPEYGRVVVGVLAQPQGGPVTLGEVVGKGVRVRTGYTVLATDDLSGVAPEATAATVCEFTRDAAGAWTFRMMVRGFEAVPGEFGRLMGGARP
ncbi:TerD-family protein [Streptomyces mashuensis]|uniref:TerD-family protein n=1 Tax=Streptomyces mashuensis TaxID=33904 RepID=A0A919B8V9_9ACTN|nr:TerD family protein [Streptomyces mashuensis]GHF65276.1 TerD-family protein [Streptomyces mashuensis]